MSEKMSMEQQTTLLGETNDATATLETEGSVYRPFFALPDALLDESRHEFGDDGVCIGATDAAMVALVEARLHPEALDGYQIDGEQLTVGMDHELLAEQLADARMSKTNSDSLSMEFGETQTQVTVQREYQNTTVTRHDEFLNIDSASVRDYDGGPDVELKYSAEVDTKAFRDVVNHINSHANHIIMKERDGHLVVNTNVGEDTQRATSADFGDIVETDADAGKDSTARFSLDYLTSMADALRTAKIDTVTLAWGHDFPLKIDFERREEDTTLYSGSFGLAPRIHREGNSP